MDSFPESRDIRKSLFKKFVKKPNEKQIFEFRFID